MSDDATFSFHINGLGDKIKIKIAWIFRTFQTRESIPMLTLWKQLVLGDHDCCSQLWHPSAVSETQSWELLQQSFLRRITETRILSYWEQLKSVHLYSLERRRERYLALYAWKIPEGIAPNISSSLSSITAKWHCRRGRECKVPTVRPSASQCVQKIRRASFAIKGPRLFNCLSKCIRNLQNVSLDQLKSDFDRFLATIPDEPLIPGYTQYRRVNSNSLLDWVISWHLPEEDGRRLGAHHLAAKSSTKSW
eukprot:gene13383-14755_t